MKYSYRSKRQVRKLARHSRKNFIITILIVLVLSYLALIWILPFLITSVSFVRNNSSSKPKVVNDTINYTSLAPPVLNIPYEATSSSRIDIKGYSVANSKVKLYIDDEDKGTTDVSSEGDFTFQNIDLSLGTNNIYAKTLDITDKESLPSKTIKVIYINEKPLLEISQPDDNKVIQGGDKKVTISGKTDNNVKVYINANQIIINGDGRFESNQLLNEGDNIFIIQAVDMATNSSIVERKVTYNP